MQAMRRNALAFKGFGGFAAVLWLALSLFGSSPALHRSLHQDANSPDHSCVVQQVGHGSFFFSPDSAITIPQPEIPVVNSEAYPPLFSSHDFRVAFSRGPPAFPASRTVAG
jgi:hypothetical protein